MKEKSIPDIAAELAKMTVRTMSKQELKEWADLLPDLEPKRSKK